MRDELYSAVLEAKSRYSVYRIVSALSHQFRQRFESYTTFDVNSNLFPCSYLYMLLAIAFTVSPNP